MKRREDGSCWVCAKPKCFGRLGHAGGRFRHSVKLAYHAKPKSGMARLRLLWHDFMVHSLFNMGGERCQDCGRSYVLWSATTNLWKRVMGDSGGLLCPLCFDRRAKTEGITVEWIAHVISGYEQ